MATPFDRRTLDVGDGHRIYIEQSGHPQGQPVVVLHGGPGSGSSPYMRRFFDPDHYRLVMFDQRGCGRSRPNASVTANTTQHLIGDIRKIRQELGIDRWMVFGGSWGATLALAYAQTFPDEVQGLVLRGVFLGRQRELDWFYAGGAGRFWPDLWARFCAPIPPEERGDMIAAYHRRLFCDDWRREAEHALPWLLWENALAVMQGDASSHVPPDYARAFARLENHYFINRVFLEEGQLLRNRHLIEHIPTVIVQGRYDMVCPPISAWELADGWRLADLRMVSGAGHALSEPGIATELIRVMDALRG
ncbi:prolyl aminopeptidase [Paracoccus pacificus]|uniref:Proline iminopeptidase n=1 Tax=Paracoccus pacificus TaxID=1463598 RepID=A0ABW4R8X4_9RHOB